MFVDETVQRIGAPPQDGMTKSIVVYMYTPDFNEDGCADLLFPTHSFPEKGVLIWLNNCQGYFSPLTGPILPEPDGEFLSYVPLDYDGDGDIDLLSANAQDGNFAGTEGCSEGEGGESDYIDFSVLLNVNPTNFKSSLIFKSGFDE